MTKGAVKFSDRRVGDGRFLLTPTPQFRNVFGYWFAFFARKYQMRVHGLMVMGTHYHALQSDTLGKFPNFTRDFHAKMAHEMHRLFGAKGQVWCTKTRGGVMDVVSPQAYVKTRHYMLCNPVEAGICANPQSWPGLFKRGELFMAPKHALAKDNSLPAMLSIPMAACDAFKTQGCDAKELELRVEAGKEAAVEEVHWQRVREGKRYQKVKRALTMRERQAGKRQAIKQAWGALKNRGRAKPQTKGHQTGGRGFVPRWVAAGKEAMQAIEAKLKAFRKAYLKAYRAYQAGNRKVEFPYGTWHMVHIHGCPCAEP